jgi:hypothetical protein
VTELTPEERERIYQEEKARLEARQALELQARREQAAREATRRQKTVLVLVLGSIAFVGLCTVLTKSGPSSPAPRSPEKVLEERTKAEEGVEILRQGGVLIRLDAENRKAYVDNGVWKLFPENMKIRPGHSRLQWGRRRSKSTTTRQGVTLVPMSAAAHTRTST